MKRQTRFAGWLGLVPALLLTGGACSSDPADPATSGTGGTGAQDGAGATAAASDGSGTGGSMDVGSCVSDGQLVITDDTNYSFSSTLTIQSTTVKDGEDLLFDWSQLTRDFFGRDVAPLQDVDIVLVSLWRMTETELGANLNKDNLPLGSNLGALTSYPEGAFTSAHLLEFDSFGSEVPLDDVWERFDTSTPGYQYPPDSHTFMLMAGTEVAPGEIIPGKNTRMLAFFRLDPASTNTTVSLTNESTTMEYSVDLANIKQVPVPAGMAALTIDWSQMTVNALGNEYDGTQITEAVVAHYSMTLEELQAQFLFLEERSDAWYEGEVLAGKSMELNTLQDKNGATFPGVDSNGVWLVALRCTKTCNNPAPWSITVLRPCP